MAERRCTDARWRVAVVIVAAAVVLASTGRAQDEGRIYFTRAGEGQSHIYSIRPDGSDDTRLTHDEDMWHNMPAASPDGRQLALRWNTPDFAVSGIAVMSHTGSGLHMVVDRGQQPAWSPDGLRLAYVCFPDRGQRDLCLANTDGNGVTILTRDEWDDQSIAWAPDSRRIAFSSNRDPAFWLAPRGPNAALTSDIYTMDVASGETVNLTRTLDHEGEPAWSPDGRSVAFSRGVFGTASLHTLNVETGRERQLVGPEMDSHFPAWSPDGSRVLFTSFADVSLYIVDRNGDRLTRLTTNGAVDHVWFRATWASRDWSLAVSRSGRSVTTWAGLRANRTRGR